MSILVIAEHHHTSIKPATLTTVTAACALDQDVHILVAGLDAGKAAQDASAIQGATKVLHCDHSAYAHATAENLANLIVKLAPSYTHILAPASFFGKNVMPYAAALLDVQQISDVTEIESPDTFTRPIYAGNAFETVQVSGNLKILTIRPTAFDAASGTGGTAEIISIENADDTGLSQFIGQELTKSERPELTSASIIISGGCALGSTENFHQLIEPIADKLGAAIGASRAAVDAGYVPNDYQVGQTGKIVAPELYIAVGISGAIQHLAGMKDSKVIVAINKDGDAPIFQLADYGLVGDLFQILPELNQALEGS